MDDTKRDTGELKENEKWDREEYEMKQASNKSKIENWEVADKEFLICVCVWICEFFNYIISPIQMPEGRCVMAEIGSRGRGIQEMWRGKREMSRKKWRRWECRELGGKEVVGKNKLVKGEGEMTVGRKQEF